MLDNNTDSASASIMWWEEDITPIEWEDKTIEWSDIVINPIPTIEWWEELED
jgi:hypothetical protein